MADNASLNITPYASTDNLPETANENDIAVITEEEITNWCARSDPPIGTAEGSIWIVTKTNGNAWFNIGSASSPIIIYPATVKQYISGAWVHKDSYIFQNGNWKQIVYYLYDAGEEYEAITGGWTIVNGSGGRGVKNTDNIYLGYSGSSNRVSGAYTVDVINPQSFSKLYVKYNITAVNTSYGLSFGLADTNTSTSKPNIISPSSYLTATGQHVSVLDISSVDDECYVGVTISVTNANIYQVWMQ